MLRQTITFLTICLFVGWGNIISLVAADDAINHDKVLSTRNSVVIIEGDKIDDSLSGGKSSVISYNGVGSGIIVDARGYIITNYHVIDGIRKIQVKTFDESKYQGYYVSHDPVTDIALIKIIPNKALVPITIGTSSSICELDPVVVIGNPFGYQYSVNSGQISGLNRQVKVTDDLKYNNMIQLSAAINPGNSGGPLLNAKGEVIGINAALRQGAVGIAFAIPIDLVMEVGEQLLNQQTSQFCYHGIRFKQKSKDSFFTDTSGDNSNKEHEPTLVDSVDPGSPAEEAGIQPGDIILSANGAPVDRKIDFQKALIDLQENDTLDLIIERAHEKYDTKIALRNARGINRQNVAAVAPQVASQSNSHSIQVRSATSATPVSRVTTDGMMTRITNVFGIGVRAVSQEEFYQANSKLTAKYEYEGALQVTSVRRDSILYQRGIREGDMIAGIIAGQNAWQVTKLNDLHYIAERWTSEEMGADEVTILYIRNQTDHTVRIPITNRSVAQAQSKSTW